MRRFLPIAAAVSALFSVSAAQADQIFVDDFNGPAVTDIFLANNATAVKHCYFQGAVAACAGGTAQAANSMTAGGLATQRDVSVSLTTNNSGVGDMTAKVGGGAAAGRLNLQSSPGDIGTGVVAWTIPAFTLPAAQSTYFFSVIASTIGSSGPSSISFSFTGGLGTFNVAAQSVPSIPFVAGGSPLNYSIAAADAVKLGGGGMLSMTVTGTQGWSVILDQFAFSIPEPTSLALAGLALVGAGLASRRRQAA